MANTIHFQLLRIGALLLDVLPRSRTECLVNGVGTSGRYGNDAVVVDARTVAGICLLYTSDAADD